MGIPSAMVDVATGWSERVAVMGRGQRAMEAGFEQRLASTGVCHSGIAS
jgi:hypothetical protein